MKNYMDRLLSFLIVFLVLLYGCSRGSTTGEQETAADDATTQQTGAFVPDDLTITDCLASMRFVFDLPSIPENLPIQSMTEVLKQNAGNEAAWKRGYGLTENAYQPFFAVALSEVIPLCYTPENTLVCRLQLNSTDVMLLNIDQSDLSQPIEFYFPSQWDWSSETVSLLFNGYTDDILSEICQDIMDLHLSGTGFEQLETQIDLNDNETNVYTVVVEFEKINGLEYDIPVISGRLSDHYLTAYSISTHSVLISRFDDTPYEGPLSGSVPELPDDLPIVDLTNAAEQKDVLGTSLSDYSEGDIAALETGYFHLDLSKLKPIAVTKQGEIICRLNTDTENSFFFVLDSAEKTRRVHYYVVSSWDWWEMRSDILWDGAKPTEDEIALSEYLIKVLRSRAAGEGIWLDYYEQSHCITFCYDKLDGLEYKLPVFILKDGKHAAIGDGSWLIEIYLPEEMR